MKKKNLSISARSKVQSASGVYFTEYTREKKIKNT